MIKISKSAYLFVFITVILLICSACGRNNVDVNDPDQQHNVEVLTILAPDSWRFDNLLTRARGQTRSALQREGRDFYAEITTYSWEERSDVMLRLRTMLMAGQGYDIFFLEHMYSMLPFARSGFLEDINTLIDQCQNTSREDFFTNVLDAFTIDNHLYAFPINFGFQYVGINAKLPEEFINRFADYETISYTQLIQIYLDLKYKYESDFGHLSFVNCTFLSHSAGIVYRAVNDFIDFDTNTSYLNNPAFILLLTNLRQFEQNTPLFNNNLAYNGQMFMENHMLQQRAMGFVFSLTSNFWTPVHALAPTENEYFVHSIPISDDQGRLRIHDKPTRVLHITRAGNTALAWDFVRHLIGTGLQITEQEGRFPRVDLMNAPIERERFSAHFANVIDSLSSFNCANQRSLDDIKNRVVVYSEMPIAPPPLVHLHFLEEPIYFLVRGLATPEETAQRLHNTVSLWLIE